MPKHRSVPSLPFDRASISPYRYGSRNGNQCNPEKLLVPGKNVKEWEEARCPICMEHPHNAVLLQCSSFEKGCRPYMCNTSYRHSNCLDQYCKSSVSSPSIVTLRDNTLAGLSTDLSGRSEPIPLNDHTDFNLGCLHLELSCPLCRGEIYGWSVVEPARKFMNSKARSCSSENCDFIGTYSELRKHARSEHPFVRPTDVDSERQCDWNRLERETELGDVHSILQSDWEERIYLFLVQLPRLLLGELCIQMSEELDNENISTTVSSHGRGTRSTGGHDNFPLGRRLLSGESNINRQNNSVAVAISSSEGRHLSWQSNFRGGNSSVLGTNFPSQRRRLGWRSNTSRYNHSASETVHQGRHRNSFSQRPPRSRNLLWRRQ